MLSTTIVHVCSRCGNERIRKNGHADNGAQRAKCLDGERTFILLRLPGFCRHRGAGLLFG